MSVFLDISAALDGNLNSMAGKPDIAWENVKYTPAVGTIYVRPTLIPGDTTQASLGTSGTDESIGIYQVDVFTEAGQGKNEAVVMADKIANRFKRGTVMTYNGVNVRVISVSRQVGFNDAGGYYMIPVEINYISFTQPRT